MYLKLLKFYYYRRIVGPVSAILTILLTCALASETANDWPPICYVLVFFINIIIGLIALELMITPEALIGDPDIIYYDYWKKLNKAIDTDNTYKIHELAARDLKQIMKCTYRFMFCSWDMDTMSNEKTEKIFDLMTMYQPDIFTDRFKNRVIIDLANGFTGRYIIYTDSINCEVRLLDGHGEPILTDFTI